MADRPQLATGTGNPIADNQKLHHRRPEFKALQKGAKTPMIARFSTVAGEIGAVDAERDVRGFALKFYTEEGNWNLIGNNIQKS